MEKTRPHGVLPLSRKVCFLPTPEVNVHLGYGRLLMFPNHARKMNKMTLDVRLVLPYKNKPEWQGYGETTEQSSSKR